MSMSDWEFEQLERAYERRASAEGLCLKCGVPVYFQGWTHGVAEGHIYSDAGLAEFKISGFCEYCFDLVTLPPEEDEYVDHGGWEDH